MFLPAAMGVVHKGVSSSGLATMMAYEHRDTHRYDCCLLFLSYPIVSNYTSGRALGARLLGLVGRATSCECRKSPIKIGVVV